MEASLPRLGLLFLETEHGQISYHVPAKYRPMYETRIKRDDDYKWDGHTSANVVKRLETWAIEG